MKILCFIDCLGSGGAQRQMVALAGMLKKRGHQVHMLCYHEQDFYKPLLDQQEIPVEVISIKNKLKRFLALRRAIRRFNPKVVIAYLPGPSFYAELARLPGHRFKVIVSERSAIVHQRSRATNARYQFHRLADHVVANSQAFIDGMIGMIPALRKKTSHIVNMVDLGFFAPAETPPDADPNRPLHIAILARYSPEKNLMGVLEALALYSKQQARPIRLSWHGNRIYNINLGPIGYLELEKGIAQHGLGEVFTLHDATTDVRAIYHEADAVMLASFYEGCSNVICEAMSCGKPLLVSDVCDNRLLVRPGENGFLFDPHDPEDMASALAQFAAASHGERLRMGENSRRLAESLFSEDVFVDRYLDIINDLLVR